MGKTVADEVEHMLVGQRVQNVVALAFAMDDVVGAKNPEPLRDGGNGLLFHDSEIADTEGTMNETSDQSHPA